MGSPLTSRTVLTLTGLGFISFGLGYAVWSVPMASLTHIALPTPTARIDFAATYGGLQMGFGLFLLMCARRAGWTEPGLWAAVAALSGLVLVRLGSLAAAGGHPTQPIWAGIAIELGAAVANGGALAWYRRAAGRGTVA
jgi:hypothetical protein